jgi:uncharacterized protein (TIRG00374 family)
MTRLARLGIGVALGVFFLWLTLRGVDWATLRRALTQVSPGALALAPLCLALGYGARVLRWHSMLRALNPALGIGRATVALVGSTAVNNLAPLRLGDALRCFGFAPWLGVAPGAVLGTVLVERVLDLIALCLALALAVWLLAPAGAIWGHLALAALAAGGVLAGLILMMTGHHGLARRVPRWIRVLPHRLRRPVRRFVFPLMRALGQVQGGALAIWTLPVWVFEGATFWAVARALPDLTAPAAAWLAMPASTLATLLPTTPGHLGPFNFAAQAATLALGNPLIEATAFVLIIHAVLWATTTGVGLVCLAIWGGAGRA